MIDCLSEARRTQIDVFVVDVSRPASQLTLVGRCTTVQTASKNSPSEIRAVKITSKGQVTIPQPLRMKFGLLPNTEVAFEEADGCVLIRPMLGKQALIEERLRRARGIADGGLSTDELMRLTRG